MGRLIIAIASFFGATAVMLAAYGAHGLRLSVDLYSSQIFEKGTDYQLKHAILLLVIGILSLKYSSRLLQLSAGFIITGILFFPGSLYLLATQSLFNLQSIIPFLVPITPMGGMCFILGWIFLGIFAIKNL
ncbi:MAG: DUF423 domain-containing protein [Chitinophagales bacterium]|nr:DUF423 domain-containing protein [Chitinophagales bacterium]